jgi:hypothetical protein
VQNQNDDGRDIVAAVGSVDRGRETGIEPWLEQYRQEFCLAPPAELDLTALEALAA